jgi:hypothetical protein
MLFLYKQDGIPVEHLGYNQALDAVTYQTSFQATYAACTTPLGLVKIKVKCSFAIYDVYLTTVHLRLKCLSVLNAVTQSVKGKQGKHDPADKKYIINNG